MKFHTVRQTKPERSGNRQNVLAGNKLGRYSQAVDINEGINES